MTEACMSFDYSAVSSQCSWYPVGDRNYVREQLGYVYYETHIDKVRLGNVQRGHGDIPVGSAVFTAVL